MAEQVARQEMAEPVWLSPAARARVSQPTTHRTSRAVQVVLAVPAELVVRSLLMAAWARLAESVEPAHTSVTMQLSRTPASSMAAWAEPAEPVARAHKVWPVPMVRRSHLQLTVPMASTV
jgi:hypothetical protein